MHFLTKNTLIASEIERRQTDRQRKKDKEIERQTERDRQRKGGRERGRERETDRDYFQYSNLIKSYWNRRNNYIFALMTQ